MPTHSVSEYFQWSVEKQCSQFLNIFYNWRSGLGMFSYQMYGGVYLQAKEHTVWKIIKIFIRLGPMAKL